ncbi:MAG: O-antigen ligase family protein [Verrucomicrobiia bacterium]
MGSGIQRLDRAAEITEKIAALIALLGLACLLGGTLAYWGGSRPERSWVFFWIGAALWANLALYAAASWIRGRRLGTALDLIILLFIAYFLWWYARAPIPFLARWEGLWIFTYAAVFWNARYIFPTRSWGIALLILLVIFGTVQAGFGLSKLGQHVYEIWGENRPDYGRRISGFFGCPNHFGNFLVMSALTATVLATIRRGPWLGRIFLIYAALMMTAGVLFSISRGSYLAWLAGFGLLSLLWAWHLTTGTRWIKIIVAAGGTVAITLAGLGFWFFSQQERALSLFRDDFRFRLFDDAWRMFLQAPWIGYGPATFDFVHQRFHGPEFQSRAYYTHNDYLNTLCDYGLVGLALVLGFVGLLAWSFRPPPESKSTARQTDLAALGYAVLAASLVHALVDFNFHLPACALTFFVISGLASSRTHRQQRPHICLPGNPIFILASIAAAAWMTTTILPAQRAWNLLPYSDEGLAELSEERIRILANRITAADPLAGPLFARLGDAARHRLAAADERVNALRQAIARHQAHPDDLEQPALEQQRLGDLALKLYAQAARLNPLDDTLTVKQGIVLDLMGRPEEAYLAYSRARQNQPHNRFFTFVFGYHYLRSGYLEQALAAYRHALSIPPGLRERNRPLLEASREAIAAIEAELQRRATPTPP